MAYIVSVVLVVSIAPGLTAALCDEGERTAGPGVSLPVKRST